MEQRHGACSLRSKHICYFVRPVCQTNANIGRTMSNVWPLLWTLNRFLPCITSFSYRMCLWFTVTCMSCSSSTLSDAPWQMYHDRVSVPFKYGMVHSVNHLQFKYYCEYCMGNGTLMVTCVFDCISSLEDGYFQLCGMNSFPCQCQVVKTGCC